MKSSITIFLFALILLFPLFFMWQGLDLTDAGYTVANMQQFFQVYPGDLADPAIGSCWLTFLIGAIWYKLAGGWGLAGFRVLYLLLTFAILGLAAVLLGMRRRTSVLLALLAAMLVVIARTGYVPSYNEVTALCFILSALGLYHGLVRNRWYLIFLAGVVGGISIFARLPNVAVAALVVAVIYFRCSQSLEGNCTLSAALRSALREGVVFGGGYVAGIMAVLGLMAAMGELVAYGQTLRQMSAMFGDSTQHHGSGRLLHALLHDYFYSGLAGLGFVAVAAGLGIAARRLNRTARITLIIVVVAGLTAALFAIDELDVYLWPGVLYAILLAGAFGCLGLDRNYRLLCVLAGLVLFVTPLGSNNGIYNAVYAMHLAVPVALAALIVSMDAGNGEEQPEVSARRLSLVNRLSNAAQAIRRALDLPAIGYAVLCSMAVFSIIHRWQFTYRDAGQRLAMTTAVDHPKLRGILTTPTRARCLEQLLTELQPLVHENDYLMDHMQIPMIYFLTETKPYLYSAWANLYEPQVLKGMMDKASIARTNLPVCVLTKVDVCSPEWPNPGEPLPQPHRFVENRLLVESFLHTHNYQKHWENSGFEVWLPPSFKSPG